VYGEIVLISLLVITHSRLGRELVGAAEFILGKMERTETLAVEASQVPEVLQKQLEKMIKRLRDPDGVLVLTDMFGGTPNNISLAHLEQDRVEVVTGVNLPMIIKAATSREKLPLAELARQVCQAGKDAISVAGELLSS
jgi:PTS system mannose-specific IIA component